MTQRIGINGHFWSRPSTGSGQYVRELVPALERVAPEDEYALILPQSAGTSTRTSIPPRTTLIPTRVPQLVSSEHLAKLWFEQFAFGRACRLEQVTLAHVPYFASPFFPPGPTVVTIHDLIPLLLPLYRGSARVRAYTQLVAASARRANAIIVDSDCSRRDVIRHLKVTPSRVHVVYLAVDARYRPVEDVTAVRSKYALPDKTLLYLGGYDQRKNVGIILQAFARLPELYRDGCRLVLGGTVPHGDSAFFPSPARMAREAGLPEDAVRYIGGVEEQDKPALYSSAILSLFPSRYEGFGLPPLEAMACGTPVICSNASSLPEIVGDAAVCVDPDDLQGWADAIHDVLAAPGQCESMRTRSLAQAAKFSWERAARETEQVYRSAMRL